MRWFATRGLIAALAFTLVAASTTIGQDGPPAEDATSGRLEAASATELKLELKNYSGELRLKMILAPGTKVEAGQTVAEVDATDYDRLLARTRENTQLAEQSLQAAQDAAEHLEATMPLQVQKAQRDLARAEEALAHFTTKEKANRIRNAEMGLEGASNSIEDQKEELRQLEILYQGNDLAKESQDIVLNRSKRRLKQSEERFEMQKESHKRFLEVELPRQEADLEAALAGAKAEAARVERLRERGNVESIARLVRARQGVDDARRALADLEADRDGFALKAPHAGVVVVGALAGNNSVSAAIRTGDKLKNGQSLAAVVDAGTIKLTFTFPATAQDKVKVGSSVEIRVGAVSVQARITAVGFMVDARGRLSASAEIENTEGKLLPGSRAEARLAQ